MMNLFAPVLTIVLLQFGAAIGSQLRPDESKRGLQGDFSIESMDFSMAGVYFTPEVAQEACPEQWQGLVSCIIQTCPTLFEDCPTSSSSEFNKTLEFGLVWEFSVELLRPVCYRSIPKLLYERLF